ncbi:DUF4179 domain-containing protein [Paenibacillus spongiae]|uniref:DUF4179 domain-containing protein n=1 Tax=Paenibacillus spongiae TaxID=2909671 RepID=A0ABY5S3E6_9BACL|nr:DUF4179 domain-containing protein [Paenibacillus spongiae]UVI28416.1 DUF4179 domain-containing protein [Paenibacillus spongiae]
MNNRIESLKKAYEEIEIPDELAAVTEAAIQKGRMERQRKKPRRANRWVKWVGVSAAGLFVLFTVSINTMPALASSLEQIPGLGTLVRTLQFNKGTAGGGAITDSTDVNVISLHKKEGQEQIVIHFQQNNQPQQIANSFSVKYSEYPNMMSFAIGGARKFSAEQDLAALKNSEWVEDAYEIISLDDSLIRFNVIFKDNVAYEVQEYKEPAQVVLTLKPGESHAGQPPVYSVRTASSPYGESQGIYEEMLFGAEGLRTMKDKEGTYFVEAGYFKTEAEAEAKRQKWIQTHGFDERSLFIERREALQIPEAITVEEPAL